MIEVVSETRTKDTKQKAQYLYTATQHLTQDRDRNACDNSMNTTPADLQITAETKVLQAPWPYAIQHFHTVRVGVLQMFRAMSPSSRVSAKAFLVVVYLFGKRQQAVNPIQGRGGGHIVPPPPPGKLSKISQERLELESWNFLTYQMN